MVRVAAAAALVTAAALAGESRAQFSYSIGGFNEVVEQMFSSMDNWPCSRLITRDGAVGCGSPNNDEVGIGGPIIYLQDNDAVKELLAATPDASALTVLMPEWALDAALMKDLIALNAKVPVASAIFLAPKSNARRSFTSPAAKTSFNSLGDGLSDMLIPFPVTRLVSDSDSDRLLEMASENVDLGGPEAGIWQNAARLQFYMGKGDVKSQDCLAQSRCDPIGGNSVWGTVVAPLDSEKEVVMITSPLDSAAFFHDLAFGRNAGASSIVTTLLAARALAKMPDATEVFQALPRQIAVGLFQGESYDRVGSRRFVRDIGTGLGCQGINPFDKENSCLYPNVYSLAWTGLSLDSISHVLALDQLLVPAHRPLYMHVPSGTNSSRELVDIISSLAENRTEGSEEVMVEVASESQALPDTPLTAFGESQWSGVGLVLAGYNDRYADSITGEPSYHSRYDRVPSGLKEDADAGKELARIATLVARTAFVSAGGDAEDAALITVDEDYAVELWECFAIDFACPIVADTFGSDTQAIRSSMAQSPVTAATGPTNGGPPTLFAGVYRVNMVQSGQTSLVESFVHDFLALEGRPDDKPLFEASPVGCSVDFDCLLAAGPACPAGNSSRSCVRNKCSCPYVFYHDAVTPAIHFQPIASGAPNSSDYRLVGYNVQVQDASDILFTEPRWQTPTLVLYYDTPRSTTTIVLLVVGIFTTAATWVVGERARKALRGTRLKLE